MPLSNSRVTVTDTRQELIGGESAAAVLIRNTDDTDSVYVGDSTVTAANGYEIPAGEAVTVPLVGRGDALHGICGAGLSAVVHLLSQD